MTKKRKSIFHMSPEERQAFKDANPPQVSGLHSAHTYFDWTWNGCGFGQLDVFRSKDGTLTVGNECMSRDNVRAILHAWADFIADRAVLQDNPEDVPPVDFAAEQEADRIANDEYMKKHGLI